MELSQRDAPRASPLLCCGTCNAHSVLNKKIQIEVLVSGIVLVNDGEPTYGLRPDSPRSVLDLIFVFTYLSGAVTPTTTNSNCGSDQCLVTLYIPLKFETTCISSSRLGLNKVKWDVFDQ